MQPKMAELPIDAQKQLQEEGWRRPNVKSESTRRENEQGRREKKQTRPRTEKGDRESTVLSLSASYLRRLSSSEQAHGHRPFIQPGPPTYPPTRASNSESSRRFWKDWKHPWLLYPVTWRGSVLESPEGGDGSGRVEQVAAYLIAACRRRFAPGGRDRAPIDRRLRPESAPSWLAAWRALVMRCAYSGRGRPGYFPRGGRRPRCRRLG